MASDRSCQQSTKTKSASALFLEIYFTGPRPNTLKFTTTKFNTIYHDKVTITPEELLPNWECRVPIQSVHSLLAPKPAVYAEFDVKFDIIEESERKVNA